MEISDCYKLELFLPELDVKYLPAHHLKYSPPWLPPLALVEGHFMEHKLPCSPNLHRSQKAERVSAEDSQG